jgi:hypothetical protein
LTLRRLRLCAGGLSAAVKAAIDELKAAGVRDIARHLTENPDFIHHAMSMVRIVDVNDRTIRLFDAHDKEELLERDEAVPAEPNAGLRLQVPGSETNGNVLRVRQNG